MSNLKRRVATLLAGLLAAGASVFTVASPASADPVTNLFGPYTVRPAANVGQCLDVRDVSYNNGALLQTYQCLGSQQTNQVFYFWKVEGTASRYQITPAHSWKCLDVRDVSQAGQTPLQQYDCLGTSQINQIFDVQVYGGINKMYPVHSAWNDMKVTYGWGGANGGPVYQCNICTGNDGWYFFLA